MPFRRISPIVFIIGWPLVFLLVLRLPTVSLSVAGAWFSLFMGIGGFCGGLYLFLHGFRLLQRKQWIEDTPISKIAGAAMGRVGFFGKAVGPYTLLSPLAEVDCYYYRAVALTGEEMDRRPKEGATESMFTPLFIEDETGRVMIDPRGAQLDLPAGYISDKGNEELDPCCLHFLARHGLLTEHVSSLREYAIKPGDELFVLGQLGENRGLTSLADARAGALPGPGEGYLSAEAAWLQKRQMLEAMGVASMDEPLPQPGINSDFDLHSRIVVSKGVGEEPFLLCNRPPGQVVERSAEHAALAIWGGPLLAMLSLALLMKGLNVW
jgi:hypothetical protein